MNFSDIAVFVTVDTLFPGATADESALRAALQSLSRDDALFTCARINAIVSGFAPQRSQYERQRDVVSRLCTATQKLDLSRYARRHGGPDRVMVFFRGQMLELGRWVATHCENRPGDGDTFQDPTVCSAFVRAALIASSLWERRLFGRDGFIRGINPDDLVRRALGATRMNVAEGNQVAHPGFTISRGWLLFTRYLPAHLPQFDNLFKRTTSLTLHEYFVSAFAVLNRTFSDHPEENRIFATEYVQDDTPFRDTFANFIRLQSQTPEDWARTLAESPNAVGYRSLRERPIFSFARGRSIIFDPTFYIDNLTSAPLFHVRSAGVPANEVFGAFGEAFEDYAQDLLRTRFPSGTGILHQPLRCGVRGANADGEQFEIDAVVNDGRAVIVMEMKAAWIRDETAYAEDPDVFLNEVRRKYGYLADSRERPKGIAQLARSVGALVCGEWSGPDREYVGVAQVYPVLTVFDSRMAAPGSGQFLDEEFRARLGPVPNGIQVHRLIILTIGDLEHLVFGIEAMSLREFLHAYSIADPDRISSVHNFIAGSKYLNEVRSSPVLEDVSKEFIQVVRAELFPNAP